VFWTVPVPQREVTVDFEDTIARLRVRRLTVFDDHDLANSLTSGLGLPGDLGFSFPKISPVAPVPATVSFDIGWSSNLGEAKITNASQGFQGSFRQTTAAMSWSAQQEGFRFESDAANTSISVFAVIGTERNGIFFSS